MQIALCGLTIPAVTALLWLSFASLVLTSELASSDGNWLAGSSYRSVESAGAALTTSASDGIENGISPHWNGERAPITYIDFETAALEALDYIYPISKVTNWEWGGEVYQQGNRYLWSRIVTSRSQSEVNLSEQQVTCLPFGTPAAHFQTHPPKENPVPSGKDIVNADQRPQIVFYLAAPKPSELHWPPLAHHMLRYQKPASGSAAQNVFELQPDGTWRIYP